MELKYLSKKENLKNIFNIIQKEIPSSIFKKIGYEYFNHLVEEKFIHVYIIKKNKKIASIITVVDYKSYRLLGKETMIYLFKKPHLLIKNLFTVIKSSSKNLNLNLDKNHLHLLHLIIFSKYFKEMSLTKKDKVINIFYKKIAKKHKSKYIFLCLEKENIKALRYYKRNKFKFFYNTNSLIYLKKSFKN